MADASRQLRALESGAANAQRVLESAIAAADESWTDDARRGFEADHLHAIRSDARLLRLELRVIAIAGERAARALRNL